MPELLQKWRAFMKKWEPAHLQIIEGKHVYLKPTPFDFMQWLAENEK